MTRDPLVVLYSFAQQNAIGCHARGDWEQERRWLDVLHLLDQAAEIRPTASFESEDQ